MPIKISYAPSAASVGSVAQYGGLGKFNERQREQALQEARFMADQMQNQARFMAQQQQQAIENRMRGDQMAESAAQNRNTAWRQAAQDQMGAAQAQDQSRLRWAQGFADFENRTADRDLRERQFDAQEGRADREFGLREQQFGYAQERDTANRDMRQQLAEMEDERRREELNQKMEVARAKMDAPQRQQLAKLQQRLGGVDQMIQQAGVLGAQPRMLQERARIQGEINTLVGEAAQNTMVNEQVEAEAIEKRKAMTHWNDNGVPKQYDPKTQTWQPTEEWKIEQKRIEHESGLVATWQQKYFEKNGQMPTQQQTEGFRRNLRPMTPEEQAALTPNISQMEPAPTVGGFDMPHVNLGDEAGGGQYTRSLREPAGPPARPGPLANSRAMAKTPEEIAGIDFVEEAMRRYPDLSKAPASVRNQVRLVISTLRQQEGLSP